MSEHALISIRFQEGGNFGEFDSSGWWASEKHGTWSVDTEATIALSGLRPGRAHRASISAMPFVHPPAIASQMIMVTCDESELFKGKFSQIAEINFIIPEHAVSANGSVKLTFNFPDAVSPVSVGASGDSRKLGFSFVEAIIYCQSDNQTDADSEETVPAGKHTKSDAMLADQKPLNWRSVHGQTLAVTIPGRLHDLWAELDVVVNGTVNKSGPQYPFMRKFVGYLRISDGAVREFTQATSQACGTSLLMTYRNALADARIPRLTHRIWLTKDDAPVLPPDEVIDHLLRADLNLPSDVTHFFWSNSAVVREYLQRKAITMQCNNFVAMDSEIFGSEPAYDIVTKFVRDRKFPQAADVLRFLIVHRFGGIYADLGGLFDAATLELVCACDYALTGSGADFIQAGFFAAAPHSDLTGIFRAIFNNPYAMSPAYAVRGLAIESLDELNIFGGPGLTVCALLFLPTWARTVICPMQSRHMQFESQRSWYGTEPKFGNVLVEKSSPTILNDAEYRETDKLVDASVWFFGTDPVLRERLRILVATAPYFAENPTHFCRVFSYHGSDKALGWHNYAYVYNYIFSHLRHRARRILEIGIGTNHLDVPSNMGVSAVPGASLRAWRELFPLARVIGADVDRRILFEDDRIQTFFVDQTRPETLEALVGALGEELLDLAVDDGLHTFDANLNAYRVLLPRVRRGGYLVIEDVRHEDVERWEEFLARENRTAAIVSLPNPVNRSDNRLVLVKGEAVA